MRCQKLRSLLPAYCKSELESSVTSSMELHFHSCESCREDLAAHRMIATTVASLADSASNESLADAAVSLEHPFEDSFESRAAISSKAQPTFEPLQVSSDFNNNLMERIAQERFAETRASANTKAFLPKFAPRFAYRRLVPALVSVTAVAAFAFVSLQQGLFDNTGAVATSAVSKIAASKIESPINSALVASNADARALSAPALGEQFGLSDEYMTAVPIDNPTFEGLASSSAVGPVSPFANPNTSLASSARTRPLSNSRRWHFARDYARARRILSISNALCRSRACFQILQFDANGALIGPVGGSVVFQYGPSIRQRVVGTPQIIVQPMPNSPTREQTPKGRMVRGSF